MYRVPKGRIFQFGDVIGCSLTLVKQALRKQQYAENSRKAFTDRHGRMDSFRLQHNEIILVSNLWIVLLKFPPIHINICIGEQAFYFFQVFIGHSFH